MKFTIVTCAMVVALASAKNCSPGFNYCAHTLEKVGNYRATLDQAAHDHDRSVLQYDQMTQSGKNTLWFCKGGREGVINFVASCPNGCENVKGKNDRCIPDKCTKSTEVEEELEGDGWSAKLRFQREDLKYAKVD